MTKQLIHSVSIKDCEVQAFKGSGAGGQKRNKTSSAIRVIHHPSGAVGQSADAREQHINKRNAFLRMVETKEFKAWHRVQVLKILEILPKESIEEIVDREMSDENLKIEIKDDDGNWTVEHKPICTCKSSCASDCKGRCGCEKCSQDYSDFLSNE